MKLTFQNSSLSLISFHIRWSAELLAGEREREKSIARACHVITEAAGCLVSRVCKGVGGWAPQAQGATRSSRAPAPGTRDGETVSASIELMHGAMQCICRSGVEMGNHDPIPIKLYMWTN
jgi:hypothetical protein